MEEKFNFECTPFTISSDFEKSIYLLNFQNNNLSCLHQFENIHSELITSHKFLQQKDFSYIISTSFDKTLKITRINNDLTEFKINKQVISNAPKKISGHAIENDEIIFCDKFGNILRLSLQESMTKEEQVENQNIQANFEEITIMKFLQIPKQFQISEDQQKYFLIQDEYYKIKVFNYPKIYKISALWTPMKKKIKQVEVMNDRLLFLFFGSNQPEFWSMEFSNLEIGEWKASKLSFLENLTSEEKLLDILFEKISDTKFIVLLIYSSMLICQSYEYTNYQKIERINQVNVNKNNENNIVSVLQKSEEFIIVEGKNPIQTEKFNIAGTKKQEFDDKYATIELSNECQIFLIKF